MIQTTTPRTTRIRYRATRGSGSWTSITDGIDNGSLDIDDLLTNSLYEFGRLNASKFECKLYKDIDLAGKEILVDQQIDGQWKTPIFHGFVESAKLDNTHTYRSIVAYDEANTISEIDISEEWETYWATREYETLRNMILRVCQWVGYDVTFATPQPTVLTQRIGHSIDLSNSKMTFGQMLYYLCELCGGYPHIYCSSTSYLYVIKIYFPSISSPTSLAGLYETGNSDFEDYSSDAIGGVIYYEDGVDRLNIGSGNQIILDNNPLIYDRTDAELTAIGNAYKTDKANLSVNPFSVEMIVSAPDLEIGSAVSTENGTGIVMRKRLYGVQLFSETLDCYAEKTNDYPTYYNPEIRRLHGRVGVAEAQLEVLDDEIATKVSQTTYTQGINAVNARVDTTNGNVTALGGRVDTAESNIGTLETGVSGLSSRVTTAESSITQNAYAITQKVSTTDYNGQEIVSLINQSADGVQIKGKHIEIEGVVSANDTFIVDEDGYMQATGGKIGGFTIGANDLKKEVALSGDTYRIALYAGDNIDVHSNAGFYILKRNSQGDSYPFRVFYDGKVSMDNIEANGGKIGKWNITSSGGLMANTTPATANENLLQVYQDKGTEHIYNTVSGIGFLSALTDANNNVKQYTMIKPDETIIVSDATTTPDDKVYFHDDIVAVEKKSNGSYASDAYMQSDRIQVKNANNTSYMTPTDISVKGKSPFGNYSLASADSRVVIDMGRYCEIGNMIIAMVRFHTTANTTGKVDITTQLPNPLFSFGVTGYNGNTGANDGVAYWFNGTLYTNSALTANVPHNLVLAYLTSI